MLGYAAPFIGGKRLAATWNSEEWIFVLIVAIILTVVAIVIHRQENR